MPRRSPLYLLLLAGALVALTTWLTVTVYAGRADMVTFPDAPEAPLVPESRPSTPSAAALPPEAREVRLRIELEPKARLVVAEEAALPLVVSDGVATLPAQVEALAGIWAAPRREPSNGKSLVRIRLPDGTTLLRVVSHRGDDVLPLSVVLTSGVAFAGIVRDERGVPLPGAMLTCDGVTTTSDDEGKFAITLARGGSGVPLLVHAPGKADTWLPLELSRAPSEPIAVVVGESAAVRVRVAGPERAGEGVLVALPGPEVDTRLLRYPFWQQAQVPFVLGADGTATLTGLPKGARIRLQVRHPGLLVAEAPIVRVESGTETVLVTATAVPTLRGKVVDAHGEPLVNALVTTRVPDSDLPTATGAWLLPRGAGVASLAWALTDAKGTFAVARVQDGKRGSLVRVVANGCFGLEVQIADLRGDLEHEFALPARESSASGDPELAFTLAARGRRVTCTLVEQGRTQRSFTASDAEPVVVPLREKCVVAVRTEIDGKAESSRSWHGLAVRGRTPLVLEDP